ASTPAGGSRTGQPGASSQVGRRTARGAVPWSSIREVTVSGPTQVIRAGQMRAPSVSATAPPATSAPRAIWAAGPPSAGAGSARVTGAPARAAATAPSGSNDTTV